MLRSHSELKLAAIFSPFIFSFFGVGGLFSFVLFVARGIDLWMNSCLSSTYNFLLLMNNVSQPLFYMSRFWLALALVISPQIKFSVFLFSSSNLPFALLL